MITQIDAKSSTAKKVFRSGDYGMKGKFGARTSALPVVEQFWGGTVYADRIAILPLKP